MAKSLKIITIFIALTVGGMLAGCSEEPEPVPVPEPAAVTPEIVAPDFQLTNLAGQEISLSNQQGKPVLLNFWASWCGPCQSEMPYLQEIFTEDRWPESGMVILAVNVGDPADKARQFMDENQYTFNVPLDADASAAQSYNIRGLPTTFFIDERGIIKDMKIGVFMNKAEIEWRLVNSIIDED